MAAFDFPSSPNVNDIYTLNGVAFMWNGSVWKRYSTSTGAQGFQGAAGAAGAAGAQGAQGTNGTIGSDGAQGAQGHQGAAGTGDTGAQGAAGATGAQGTPFDRSEYNYTASGGQTAFAAAYANASDVDVFMNGVRLTPAEYTPSGGTTITLASGATAGDIIDILTFASAGPTGAQGAQGAQGDAFNRSESNFTATSGQTSFAPSGGYTNGDDLDVFVNGVRLTPADYTATNGTNVVLDVGANTGDIVDIIYYESAGPAGAQGDTGATGAQGAAGTNGAQGSQGHQGAAGSIPSNITAVNGTFSGNVSIAGTLTYEDVTNIDSVGVITARDTLTVYNAASTFDPHLTLYAENSNNAILVSKHASSYPDLEFRSEAGGGSLSLFKGIASEQAGNSSYYGGLKLEDNKVLLMGTGGDSYMRYDPTPGVLEIKTLVSEPIALSTNDTERLRIDSSGRIGIGAANNTSYDTNAQNVLIASDGNTGITIRSAGSTPFAMIHFADGTSNNDEKRAGRIMYQHDGDNLTLHTANTERLRIDGGGKVIIGDSASDLSGTHTFMACGSKHAFQYDGNTGTYLSFTLGSANGTVDIAADARSGGYPDLRFITSNAERLRIDSSGRVGIGTLSPISFFAGANQLVVSGGSGDGGITIHSGTSSIGRFLFADGTIGADQYRGYISYIHSDNNLTIGTDGSERLRIDSLGRLMLGTTTEGSGNADNLTVADSGHSGITIRSGTSSHGSIYFSDATSGGGEYDGYIEYEHGNRRLNVGTAGNTRLRIDSSGRVLFGGTSARTNFNNGTASPQIQVENVANGNKSSIALIHNENATGDSSALYFSKTRGGTVGDDSALNQAGDRLGQIAFLGNDGSEFVQAATIEGLTDATPGNNDMPGRLSFSVTHDGASSPVERMRINRKGFLKMGPRITDGSHGAADLDSVRHEFTSDDNGWVMYVQHTSGSASESEGILIRYRTTSPNGTGNSFIQGQDSNTTRFRFASNGGLYNYSGNNSNLSDEREKKNIVSLDAKWDKVKSWDIKKFHYNEDADSDDLRYGVIAQQVEEHCPEVVSEWTKQQAESAVLDEDGNVVTPAVPEITRKGVKEQQMMWMAIKALQEAQTRIETLETQNADLLARVTALEG